MIDRRAGSPTGRVALAALGLLLACGPETSGGSSSDDSGGTASTGETTDAIVDTTEPTTDVTVGPVEPLATCECVFQGDEDHYIDCERCGASRCGTIERGCEGEEQSGDPFCSGGGVQVLDMTAVDCAIDLLIEGAPGFLWYRESPDLGFTYSGALLKVGAERLGLTVTYWGEDQSFYRSAHAVVPLRDAAYFVGCKALTDPYARYTCLKDWTAGPPVDTCDEPLPPE